jgi:uncharacterized membrane protein YhhN
MTKKRRPVKGWRKVNTWSFKGPLLVVGGLLGFLDHSLHWGRAVFAAGVAMLIPIIGFRDFWKDFRFWVTVVLLGIFQVPLVILLRPLADELKFPFMLVFGILDCMVVALVISWICSQSDAENVI